MVSIIIPLYNAEKYIDNILSCIRSLEYSDYEVIFVNDGSRDGSLEKLQKAALLDSKLAVYSQENRGVSAARNLGISKSGGEYIAFVDVDDEIDKNYLNIFLSAMEKNGADAAFCDSVPQKIDFGENIESRVYEKNELLRDMLMRKIQTGVCGVLVKRELLLKNGLTFMEGYKYSEDLHMVWRIFNCSEKTVYIKAPMYIYKQNEGSAMTKIDENRLDSVKLMENLEPYFEKTNPEFYPLFKEYAAARIAWATLWQAVRYLDYRAFLQFAALYDYSAAFRKLKTFPDKKVSLSARCYLVSKRIYYEAVKIIVSKYRK